MSKIIINDTEYKLSFNTWSFSDTMFNFFIKSEHETIDEIRAKFANNDKITLITDDFTIDLNNYKELTQISMIMNYPFENEPELSDCWSIGLSKVQEPKIVEEVVEEEGE